MVKNVYWTVTKMMLFYRQEIHNILGEFKRYHHVWKDDRDEVLKDLLERSPSVEEFEQRILSYKDLIDQINAEPQFLIVGSIAVYTGKFKCLVMFI